MCESPILSAHPDVEIIAFHGPYFLLELRICCSLKKISGKSILVIDLSDVPIIDETGALTLLDFVRQAQQEDKSVYLGGLNKKPLRMLLRMGVVDSLDRKRVCVSLEKQSKEHLTSYP